MSTMGHDYKDIWSEENLFGGSGFGSAASNNEIPAFFNLDDLNDDEEVKKWLDNTIPILKSQALDYSRKSIENLLFYKGVPQDPVRPVSSYRTLDDVRAYYKTNKISLNIIHEFVELAVNRISQYKADIVTIPKNDDSSARDAASAKELAIKDFLDREGIDELLEKFDRQNFILGESFFYVTWDYDKGDIHPAFSEIKDKYKGIKRVKSGSGDEVTIDRLPRIGDVSIQVLSPLNVLFEDRDWRDADYHIVMLPVNVDKARSDYPDIEIKGSGDIICYEFYHLPTRYLQKGRYVKYIAGEIVENTDYPLAKPVSPLIRTTNIDIVGCNRGKSFIENIKPHQVLINESISSTWDNLRRTARGKWLYPAKTVNPKHLAPESNGIEYYGATPPTFVGFPGIKSEAISFIQLLREYAEKQAGIHGVVQGTPPPNVRSGLQFAQLEEQQRRAVETTISKRKRAIEQLCEVVAAFMARYYKESDGRLVTIFGKDKEYLTKSLKIDALKQNNPVKVKNDDLLPTGKASQMAFYSDLRNNFGNAVVPDELMIDMLDSGRFNQYTEFGGATVETTMSQISDLIAGKDVEPPGEYEDLVLKWKIVVGTMRKRAFLSYSKQVKEGFKDMLLTIETLLMQKQPNEILGQQINMLSGFPVYWTPPTTMYAPPGPDLADDAIATEQEDIAMQQEAELGGIEEEEPVEEEIPDEMLV